MRTGTNIRSAIWRAFLRWARLDFGGRKLTARERWSVVAAAVPAVIRTRYSRPARTWLLTKTPTWMVTRCLERHTHYWYRVPTLAAAELVRVRFDFWPVKVGDHVRIQAGRMTAIAYTGRTSSEIIYILPNGEPEPDPVGPRLTKSGL